MSDILKRKTDHINLVLEQQHQVSHNPFDQWQFTHNALPEKNLDDIDLSTTFLGHPIKLPFLISSMTGGPLKAETINAHLAEAAQELGLAMGVGSQRIALESDAHNGLNKMIRQLAPDIPLYANIGAAQLRQDFGLLELQRAIDMIAADALILHFNPLQEAIQHNGDVDWRDVLRQVETMCRQLPVPVIAKEVGMGISAQAARKLVDAGVRAIDVAGHGGTNFSMIEGMRAKHPNKQLLGSLFADWGIPTPDAIIQIREALPEVPLIASGGIRHALDAAKSIALGADLVGQAGAVLQAATQSTAAVIEHFELMADGLRLARFCGDGLVRHRQQH